jgi:acetyl-CoA carboxylase, biotin carboxylase subunit
VPVVPGSEGRVADLDEALKFAGKIGFPVMIKASAGGGGRGIRIAETVEALGAALDQAAAEAKAAFGDGGLYLEKFIGNARHIEVQILGDGVNAIHCYERECSLQRRRQKVWEEAPASVLSRDVREALCASAVALARSVNYRGAGTLEYLYDEESERFYFIEMNTRIQVEHPVTEMITGIDLVLEQIRVAAGGELPLTQKDVEFRGHAIECRVNAENPSTFLPSPGKITSYHPPGGLGVRVDSAVYQGYTIPPFYDSMVGKLIVHGKTRTECLMRLKRALDEFVVDGIETTLPLFQKLVRTQDIIDGNYHIHWLERFLAEGGMAP